MGKKRRIIPTGLWERLVSRENLEAAFRKAFRGSGRGREACRFHLQQEGELLRLGEELVSGSYRPGPFRKFVIQDPKRRVISVAPFRDRVVHHALVAVLEPVFEPSMIYDTYANRVGKGMHKAVGRAQAFLRKSRYHLKVDVESYFASVDHSILRKMVGRKVAEDSVLDLLDKILAAGGEAPGIGMPIGNLTSQFFGNLYLSPLDHHLKDDLGLPFYLRYMDDMVAFGDSALAMRHLLETVEAFLGEVLRLRLKPSVTRIHGNIHGLPFLGFRIYPGLLRLSAPNRRRMLKGLKEREKACKTGNITETQYEDGLRSVFAHMAFADTFMLRSRGLFGEKAH
ncbi:retron-type reverse transcriptase [Desulfobotulus alkaliphilus]|uniref:Retron-type reverse transcriptase n=1 Tax=Desulfobotulus alkaliphilus TaxID=622671 RepID=A0A562RTK2_9BACT|nr:reverse transcriptase domain-containing protein [Desulfobotulus alkaliphilus]TWI72447.1 retron-type reverse transcriptase [Desulfobotulus alkaliphilus]